MSYSKYLISVARALRDEVAPALNTPQARDSLGACLRTLGTLASSLERTESRLGEGPDLAALPPDLAAAMATVDASARAGFHVPTSSLADDGPGGTVWAGTIAAAASWIRALPDPAFRLNRPAIARLLEWEQDLRAQQFSRADAIEKKTADEAPDQSRFTSIERTALESYLRSRFSDRALSIAEFRFIVGGRSRQTVLFEVAGSNALPARLVCQRDHPASINPLSSVTVQFKLLDVLHKAGIKVPRPILFETDRSVLGAPFMLTEQVAGSTVVDASDYYAPPPRSPRLAASLATQLGKLHSLPIEVARGVLRSTVAENAPGAWRAELDRIRSSWDKQAIGRSIVVEAAFGWLARNLDCVEHRDAIVHTDMLLHNVLGEHDEISAVLDWEIAHIGHPGEDLGYVRPVVEQMTQWPLFMAAYRAAGGAPITQREIDWFSLRAMLNLAAMAQFSRGMLIGGSSDDVRIAETAASWLPRLMQRLSSTLQAILAKDAA